MPGGRPGIGIDWAEFDRLCEVQCTLAELAAHFRVSEDTVERAVRRDHGTSFADYFAQKRKAGFVSLRRKQWELAMAGNATMLIFLGKQLLGQSDRHEVALPQVSLSGLPRPNRLSREAIRPCVSKGTNGALSLED